MAKRTPKRDVVVGAIGTGIVLAGGVAAWAASSRVLPSTRSRSKNPMGLPPPELGSKSQRRALSSAPSEHSLAQEVRRAIRFVRRNGSSTTWDGFVGEVQEYLVPSEEHVEDREAIGQWISSDVERRLVEDGARKGHWSFNVWLFSDRSFEECWEAMGPATDSVVLCLLMQAFPNEKWPDHSVEWKRHAESSMLRHVNLKLREYEP